MIPIDLERASVNLETAKMPWQELQRFFANGTAVFVTADLDLIDVATQISNDHKSQIEQWMQENKVAKVSDEQAKAWLEADILVWAVVIKPWLLVQLAAK